MNSVRELLPDVWASRDLPVLQAVAARIDRGEQFIVRDLIAEDTGLSVDQVQQAGLALKRRGLVDTSGAMGARITHFTDISGEAYFLTGLHPDGYDATQRLISALQQAAEHTNDPEEKSKLKAVARSLGEITKSVTAGVMTAVISGGLGN